MFGIIPDTVFPMVGLTNPSTGFGGTLGAPMSCESDCVTGVGEMDGSVAAGKEPRIPEPDTPVSVGLVVGVMACVTAPPIVGVGGAAMFGAVVVGGGAGAPMFGNGASGGGGAAIVGLVGGAAIVGGGGAAIVGVLSDPYFGISVVGCVVVMGCVPVKGSSCRVVVREGSSP